VRNPEQPLQRFYGLQVQAVTSPTRLNRHGILPSFRVSVDEAVMSLLGCSSPVRPWRWLRRLALPVFLASPSPEGATPQAFLSWSWKFLHGMSWSLCNWWKHTVNINRISHGVCVPFSALWKRVHVLPALPVSRFSSVKLLGLFRTKSSLAGSILASYGAALRLSQPLSDLDSSLSTLTIFRWVTLLGFVPSGFMLATKPPTTPRFGLPSWRFSRRFCFLVPRQRNRQAPGPHLGSLGPHLFVFRVFVLVAAGLNCLSRLMTWQQTIPSWVFASSWFTLSQWVKPSLHDHQASRTEPTRGSAPCLSWYTTRESGQSFSRLTSHLKISRLLPPLSLRWFVTRAT